MFKFISALSLIVTCFAIITLTTIPIAIYTASAFCYEARDCLIFLGICHKNYDYTLKILCCTLILIYTSIFCNGFYNPPSMLLILYNYIPNASSRHMVYMKSLTMCTIYKHNLLFFVMKPVCYPGTSVCCDLDNMPCFMPTYPYLYYYNDS